MKKRSLSESALDGASQKIAAPKGKLVLVSTPIGNLGDLSPRGLEALAEADLIAAEDTRHSGNLLHHFGLKKPMLSYYQHNEKARSQALLNTLAEGKTIALISDAGTPGISDPGTAILQEAVAAGFEADAIPGPCALIQALVLSGLPTDKFIFEGFLPRGKDLQPYLEALATEPRTMVFYQSPHRLKETLRVMHMAWGGQRQLAICRELTKKFQEINRVSLMEAQELWASKEVLGEFVLVVAGAKPTPIQVDLPAVEEHLKRLLAGGMKHKAAAKEIAQAYKLPVSMVYELGLQIK